MSIWFSILTKSFIRYGLKSTFDFTLIQISDALIKTLKPIIQLKHLGYFFVIKDHVYKVLVFFHFLQHTIQFWEGRNRNGPFHWETQQRYSDSTHVHYFSISFWFFKSFSQLYYIFVFFLFYFFGSLSSIGVLICICDMTKFNLFR